jgi:hypothetical protein
VIVEYGPVLRDGFLPAYSVADTKEARDLLVLACPTNARGQFIAPELAEAQTLANLRAFSDRLHLAHGFMQQRGRCRCQPVEKAEGDGSPQQA